MQLAEKTNSSFIGDKTKIFEEKKKKEKEKKERKARAKEEGKAEKVIYFEDPRKIK